MYVIFIIIIILIIISYILYNRIYKYNDMVYIESFVDHKFYLVQNNDEKQEASNILGTLRKNLITLSNYLYNNKNNAENKEYIQYIDLFYDKIKNSTIIESSKDSVYTSYSVNKGEQIIFCIRSRKTINKIHDINLMMYVALHESAHVACPVYDNHGPLFVKIFTFLTNVAMKLNLYKKIDFKQHPTEYCGMTISDSVV